MTSEIRTGHLAGYLTGAEPRYADHPERASAPVVDSDATDWRPDLPPIRAQIAEDCCCHAVSTVATHIAKTRGPALPWDDVLSFLHLYAVGRVRWKPHQPLVDIGSVLVHILEGMGSQGVVAEADWPEVVESINMLPPDRVLRRAAEIVFKSFHQVADGKASPDELRVLLRNRRCSTLCMVWDEAAVNAGKTVLAAPGGKVYGSHCVAVCGFIPSLRAFIIRNSHGLAYGDEGYFYLHEDYVARLTYEKFTFDLGPSVLA